MNAYEFADFIDKYCEDNTSKEAAVLLRQQADRIAELEKKLQESAMNYISICSQADEHYARVKELEKFNKAILKKGGYPYEKSNPIAWMSPDGKVSTTEGILFHIPLYTTPQTNNKNRSWSDICDEATAVWDSLDTSNQSNIECARAWFLEGYHQALTRGQE